MRRQSTVTIRGIGLCLLLLAAATVFAHGDNGHGQSGADTSPTATASTPASEAESSDADEGIEDIETVALEEVTEVESPDPGDVGLYELIGRFHPALVHFPIAWLIGLFLLDLLTFVGGRSELETVGLYVLGGVVLTLIPAAASGLISYSFYPDDPELIERAIDHRNVMLGVAGLTVVAFVLRVTNRQDMSTLVRRVYLGLLAAACGLLTVGGHLGAELVFGENYFPF